MDTYPLEFVAQHIPLMAIMGLQMDSTSPTSPHATSDQVTASLTTSEPPVSPTTRTRRESAGLEPLLSRAQMAKNLMAIFTTYQQQQPITAWDVFRYGGKANVTSLPVFNVVHVNKNYVFPSKPPGPIRPPPGPNTSPVQHSPYSPFTPSSSTYPDGLISPAWVRKYREALPAILVGFYDLWDWSEEGLTRPQKREAGPLGAPAMDPLEREKDGAIIIEIMEKRKYVQERGTKFAAVIILKSQHVDDYNVDDRLSNIRKSCGLDVKNSFFVLHPSRQLELVDFASNLQRLLYDSAVAYYKEKSKAIKKKRSRLPSPQSSRALPVGSPGPQPLNTQGWLFRYDYKGAVMAEFRGDVEGALKNYEAAYALVIDMFASTSALSPGQTGLVAKSKRWTEARVLADTICLKIFRFHLFLEQPSAALTQFNKHTSTFQANCANWDMGESSFEYWSWLSKQYRIFADSLDTASKHGLKPPGSTSLTSGPSGNVNPGTVLQHAGFYYHLAAMCSAERRRRVIETEKTEAEKMEIDRAAGISPELDSALAKEIQLDHSAITIELLTKAYEQFKKYRNSRMTLYLAAEIAGTYYEGGKYEMALKFFERIGKTYRKEGWHTVLTSILRWSLRCAKELGAGESVIEYLVELMSGQLAMNEQKRIEVQTELMEAIQTGETRSEGPRSLVLNMELINSFVTCHVQFKTRTTFVGVQTPFQVTLTCHPESPPLLLRLTSIRILFSDSRHNQAYFDIGLDTELNSSKLELIDVHDTVIKDIDGEAQWTKEVDLRLIKGYVKVFEGVLVPSSADVIRVDAVSLGIESAAWNVGMNFGFGGERAGVEVGRRKWLERGEKGLKWTMLDGRGEVSLLRVTQRPPRIEIKVDHHPPAFLDEHYPLKVSVTNSEDSIIQASMDLEVKSLDVSESVGHLTLDPAVDGVAQLNEIILGSISPGETLSRIVFLNGSSIPTVRVVSFMIHYSTKSRENLVRLQKQESLRIPFISPFETKFEIFPQPEKNELPSLLAPNEMRGDNIIIPMLERSELSLLVASVKTVGPWSVDIEGIQLLLESNPLDKMTEVTVESSAADLVAKQVKVWKPGYIFNSNYLLRLKTLDITVASSPVPIGSLAIKWKRDTEESQFSTISFSTTVIPLPQLEFKQKSLFITADIPPLAHVGAPFTLTYRIHNPTLQLADLNATVDAAEGFVFSGYKQVLLHVLPLSSYTLHYNCYPILSGRVKLPRLKVVTTKDKDGIEREVPIESAGLVDGSTEEEGTSGGLVVYVKPRTDIS